MSIIEILQQIFSATEEQTNSFSAAMKENGIYTTSHENMDVRYPKMKTDYEGAVKERDSAKKSLAELQKAAQGQGDLQAENARLKAELEQTKIDAALKVGLLSEKALDVGYLTYLIKEKAAKNGETLAMDDAGEVKGWKDIVESLKTEKPTMFESAGDNNDGYQVYKPNALHKPDKNEQPVNKDTFKSYTYEQRLALKEKNPALYKQLSGN